MALDLLLDLRFTVYGFEILDLNFGYGTLETRKPGNLETRKHGNLEPWNPGTLEPGTNKQLW